MNLGGRIKSDGNGGVVIPRSWIPWLLAVLLGLGGGGGWVGAIKEAGFQGGLDPSEEAKLDALMGMLVQIDNENDRFYNELHDMNIRVTNYTAKGEAAIKVILDSAEEQRLQRLLDRRTRTNGGGR